MDGVVSRTVPAHVPADRVLDFNIYGDARISSDIHGSLAAVLESAPDIFWSPQNGGHWIVRRFEMIDAIVKDPEYFSASEQQIPRVKNPPVYIPLTIDPPHNMAYRQAMMPKFSPRAIKALETRIREWAAQIVGAVADKGQCDFIDDVASLFPVSVFMELMGMPTERLREFRELADGFFRSQGQSDNMEVLSVKILAMLGEYIAERRASPGDDLISHFITADIGGRKMTPEELLAMCFLLFLGGMDTVTNMTGFGYQHLAGDPALQARLAADPALIPKFIDEVARCFAVGTPLRLVLKDCERFGVQFKQGEMVMCMVALGGRDDRKTPEPNRIDIDRRESPTLSFSAGPHLCIGHILARTEMRILTEEWFKRIPRFEIVPGGHIGFRMNTVLAIETLPLRW